MFKNAITSTVLTNADASTLFTNINGGAFIRDVSFVASLRALLNSRMSKDDTIMLTTGSCSYGKETIESHTPQRIFTAAISGFDIKCPNRLHVHNVKDYSTGDGSAQLCMDIIEQVMAKKSASTGWSKLEKVTAFYVKDFRCDCYINEKLKSTVVFVENMDMAKWHYLQCSIFAFLPWYFDPKKGVTELEMSLIESLRKKSPDDYLKILVEISKQFDIRACIIKNKLQGFELHYERAEVDRVKRDISSIDRDIESYGESIANLLTRRRDREIKLLGLETKLAQNNDEPSEIMEYFLCNKNINLESVNGVELTFSVKSYIEYFDESMAKKIIDNKGSYVYRYGTEAYRSDINGEQMGRLMRAIFLEQRLKIKTCAAYRFSVSGDVVPKTYFPFNATFADCMPNIHIDKFSCMGNYKSTIFKMLQNREYIGAIEQCVASCKSLNFGDSTVMKEFMKFMYDISGDYSQRACVELPDGTMLTPYDAAMWLENEDKEKEKGEEVNE